MKSILFLLFCISSLFSLSVEISDATISNGKTAFVSFEKEKNLEYDRMVLEKKIYQIFTHPTDNKKMYALIPISYYQKPSNKKIKIYYKENKIIKSKDLLVRIKDGGYEKENIRVSESKVHPSQKDTKRISQEYNEAMAIYSVISPKSYMRSEFILPLESIITSDFGKARVYNNTLNGYHSGTDFRAQVGTPIQASNDGIVVLVKERFYSGGTVIIDHGQGIYTCYFHMSKFGVKKGQKVKKSELIGLSGSSGRVTGPHVHFALRVSGEQVDPLQFISLMNKNLFKGTI